MKKPSVLREEEREDQESSSLEKAGKSRSQWRFTSLFLVFVFFTLVHSTLSFLIVFTTLNKRALELEKSLTKTFSEAIGKSLIDQILFADPAILQGLISSLTSGHFAFAFIQDSHGDLLAHTFSPVVPSELLKQISYEEETSLLDYPPYGKVLVNSVPLYYGNLGYLVLAQPLFNLSDLWLKIAFSFVVLLLFYILAFRQVLNRQTKIDEQARLYTQELYQKNEELREKIQALKISEQRAMEANQAKSIFLSNISHELRTPLNAIIGFSQVLDNDSQLSKKQKETLGTILRSGEHLLSLINDVLSVAKIESGKQMLQIKPFRFTEFLQNIVSMMEIRSQQKKLQFFLQTETALPEYVLGDEGKLKQILINLLGNAIKFTEKGYVQLEVQWLQNKAVFRVKDTGPGISEKEQEQLFNAFVQTETGMKSKEGGTGLGLAISSNFVQLMGGRLEVKSQLGQGSVFHFELELSEASKQGSEKIRKKDFKVKTTSTEFKILIVDDRSENRQLLSLLLAPLGLELKEAEDGERALVIWEAWRPHFIWMDLRMPLMSGEQVTQKIRQREQELSVEKKTIIVALTASAFLHEKEAVFAYGFDDFVSKPFYQEEIFEKLTNYLGLQFTYSLEETSGVSLKEFQGSGASRFFTFFKSLPLEWLKAFYHALLTGDTHQALQRVQALSETQQDFKEALEESIQSFQIDSLIEQLETIFKDTPES
jgi:signal transduction histidine kinase/CheY-like chemotaxis protein